jgi:hypothetical protein
MRKFGLQSGYLNRLGAYQRRAWASPDYLKFDHFFACRGNNSQSEQYKAGRRFALGGFPNNIHQFFVTGDNVVFNAILRNTAA